MLWRGPGFGVAPEIQSAKVRHIKGRQVMISTRVLCYEQGTDKEVLIPVGFCIDARKASQLGHDLENAVDKSEAADNKKK